jgi:hypothetical protein
MTDCVVDLVFHQRRVGIVMWHPSAQVGQLLAPFVTSLILLDVLQLVHLIDPP